MTCQLRAQIVDTVDGASVWQPGTGSDRRVLGLSIADAISSDRIEVLERQSRRIDHAMALLARRLVSMHLQAFAYRLRRFARFLRQVLVFDSGWRRRRRGTLQPAQYPCPTK